MCLAHTSVSSDACCGETDQALERERRGEAQVIPILLCPANWKQIPFSTLQMLPQGASTGRTETRCRWKSPGACAGYHRAAGRTGTTPPGRAGCGKAPRQGSRTNAPTATPACLSSTKPDSQTDHCGLQCRYRQARGVDANHSYYHFYEHLLSPQAVTRLQPIRTAPIATGDATCSSSAVANGV